MVGPNIAWSPAVKIPGTPGLWLRGHLGFARVKDPVKDNGDDMSVPEAGILLSLQAFNRLLFEGGMIHQTWSRFNRNGPTASFNVGVLPMPNGLFHSVYVGKTFYNQESFKLSEGRAGIGIQF